MPQVKISCIVSFSSEDPNYPASRLLTNDVERNRWLGQKGETSNSVVLQLEKSTEITSISIGTYHSALIEVLVGRSEASNQPYEVLICASSFMNLADSRNSEKISHIRTFNKDQMVPGVQAKKWDRVRVVCTQPYNKQVQFGLSFIHIFSSESQPASIATAASSSMLGRFKLRDVSSDEEDAKPGELFARFKQTGLSMGAQIRQASSPLNLDSSKKESNLLVKTSRPQKTIKTNDSKHSDNEATLSRRRDELFYSDEKDGKSDKIDKIIKRDRDDKAKELSKKFSDAAKSKKPKYYDDSEEFYDLKPTPKKHNLFDFGDSQKKEENLNPSTSKETIKKDKTGNAAHSRKDDRKRAMSSDRGEMISVKKQRTADIQSDSVSEEDDIPRGPKCLDGVVFVLSGYVNPKRASLRDAAVLLGARYSPDWGPHCTHLVCAFANTPKIDQVKRLGVQVAIVSGQWIDDCSKEQAFLPWKWFAMDPKVRISRPKGPLPKPKGNQDKTKINVQNTSPLSNFGSGEITGSGGDTDDEIEKVLRQQKQGDVKKSPEKLSPTTEKQKTKVDKNVSYDSDSSTDIDEDIVKVFKANTQARRNSSESVELKFDMTDDEGEQVNNRSNNKNTSNNSESTVLDSEVVKRNLKEPLDNLILEEILPDIFSGIKFYIDPNLNKAKYNVDEVKRYVAAYKGQILDKWPDKAIDVAVTTEKFAEQLREGKAKKCQFMRPEWVWKCNDTKELFAYEQFIIL